MRQRGSILGGMAITIAIICFAIMVGCIAVAHNDNGNSLGKVTLISHERDGDGNGNSGGDYEGGKGGNNDQRGDHNCRNFCFYGIPMPGQQPKGFIPPNPGKIPQQVADFIKLVGDFVQSVIKFAVHS